MLSIHCSAVCSAFVSIVALLSLKSQELNEKEERKSGQSTANQADKSDKQLKQDKKTVDNKSHAKQAREEKISQTKSIEHNWAIGRPRLPLQAHTNSQKKEREREIEKTTAKQIAQFKAADKQQQ